jgi:hypothetical protein
MMCLVGNIFCAVERFRRAAQAMDVEWAFELAITNDVNKLGVGRYGGQGHTNWLGPFPLGETIFPRYSIGAPAEFPALHGLVERDFWNAAGHDFTELPRIDYAKALQ